MTVWAPAWIWTVRWRGVVRTNFLMLQPVTSSIQRLTARAASTMVEWASIESLVRA